MLFLRVFLLVYVFTTDLKLLNFRFAFRPVFEGCFSEEPLPYSDPTGAAGGGNCRLDSPNQESRIQRTRGQDSRGHGHTPQNRPHGHQPPDLPEGYGQFPFRRYPSITRGTPPPFQFTFHRG